MSEAKMINQTEKEKRIYQVGLMLRRKPIGFLVQFSADNLGLKQRQAYNYIKLARKEWVKYFAYS